MLERLANVAQAAGDLLEARAKLAVRDLQRAGVASAMFFGAVVLAVVSVGAALASLALALAGPVGDAAALAITAGVGLVLAAAVALAAGWRPGRARAKRRREELVLAVQHNLEELRQALAGKNPSSKTSPRHDSRASEIYRAFVTNPQLVASALFTVVSVAGPRRSLRMLGQVVALTGLVNSLIRTVRSGGPCASAATEKPPSAPAATVTPGATTP